MSGSRGALLAVSILAAAAGATPAKPRAAYHPHIDPAEFRATVDHPYFPLVPGTTYTFAETTGQQVSQEVIAVTPDTRVVMGVACVVVHDVESESGGVVEETFDWYAQDRKGSVWYFGEATREFHAGGKVSTEGSWEAGVKGAQPGVIMPATLVPGEPYRQEYRVGVAEDMGQIEAVDDSVSVPYGTFTGCVRTRDWSALERGSEKKWYAKGLGLVRTESTGGEVAMLIAVTHP